MKITYYAILTFCLSTIIMNAQMSCDDLKDYVESEDYGTTYYSYDSDAIKKVTFHEITDDSFNTYYFAIVQFTSSYQEYIYQVDYSTRSNYNRDRYTSAGEAFWEHIHPYRNVLGCAPDF